MEHVAAAYSHLLGCLVDIMDLGPLLNTGGAGVSPGTKLQLCALWLAIITDIFVTAYTDTLHTTEVLTIILLLR